ncbi:MAG TPA: KTSC domain-containing protein [Thermoanaerobaculia bacterium]|nr:KTSC domain-containing protein [Thermoanaerobaculia bacterium]
MRRERIASSVIYSVGYDDEKQILEVEFGLRRVYRFSKVPRKEYEALMSAPSAGRYFNTVIRKKFRGRKVEEG